MRGKKLTYSYLGNGMCLLPAVPRCVFKLADYVTVFEDYGKVNPEDSGLPDTKRPDQSWISGLLDRGFTKPPIREPRVLVLVLLGLSGENLCILTLKKSPIPSKDPRTFWKTTGIIVHYSILLCGCLF